MNRKPPEISFTAAKALKRHEVRQAGPMGSMSGSVRFLQDIWDVDIYIYIYDVNCPATFGFPYEILGCNQLQSPRITDHGTGMTFWDKLDDPTLAKKRVSAAKALFECHGWREF